MTILETHGEHLLTRAAPLSFFGLQVGTRMTLLRLANGELLLHSPIAISDELRTAVDREGTLTQIVCPNVYHHLHAKGWAEAYPKAVVHAPRALAKKRSDLRIDHALEEASPKTWNDELVPLHIDGCMLDETVFIHPASKSVISADLTENFATSEDLFTRLYLKAGGIHGKPGWNRLMRFVYRDKRAARRSIDALLEHDFDRAIIAHGAVLERDAKEIIRDTFRFLG